MVWARILRSEFSTTVGRVAFCSVVRCLALVRGGARILWVGAAPRAVYSLLSLEAVALGELFACAAERIFARRLLRIASGEGKAVGASGNRLKQMAVQWKNTELNRQKYIYKPLIACRNRNAKQQKRVKAQMC